MKIIALLLSLVFIFCLASCGQKIEIPENFADGNAVLSFMLEKNNLYVKNGKNVGDISQKVRSDTAENGQSPYATVITCSDSRVPVEHIFSAGVGELFVIRTAGNVIGDFELGSVEYGAEHLGTKLVLVLGHTQCGAVDATIAGGAHGNIEKITDEISDAIGSETDARNAEILNIKNSIARIMESEEMQHLVKENKVVVKGAVYNIETGKVAVVD